jgi:hypothetical protein
MKIGDEVTRTHIYRRSTQSATLTTRRAKIIHITERNVAVKFRGKLINLHPNAVRKTGETTELTEQIMNNLGIKDVRN